MSLPAMLLDAVQNALIARMRSRYAETQHLKLAA
jgi:hypothetical protein